MASITIRNITSSNLLKLKNVGNTSKIYLSTGKFKEWSAGKKMLIGTAGVLTAGATGLVIALNSTVKLDSLDLHPPKFRWPHSGFFEGFDHASIRRGWEVYKQVCAACHSLNFVSYREFVDDFMTIDEAKEEAAEVQVLDGPNSEGKMFLRPGKLTDQVPAPYPNEEAARFANNGAYPPDLSLITLAREGGEDYIFSLLTGYTDAPAGWFVPEGQHFNPYFLGGNISMAQALYNEAIEYSDGTPATASQLAKDVSHFLVWAATPDVDQRKKYAIKTLVLGIPVLLACLFWKRQVWAGMKTRKFFYYERGAKK